MQWERGGGGETERQSEREGARARKGGNESGHKDGKGMGRRGGVGVGGGGEFLNTVGLATTNTLVISCLVADFMLLKIQAAKLRAHKQQIAHIESAGGGQPGAGHRVCHDSFMGGGAGWGWGTLTATELWKTGLMYLFALHLVR